MFPPNIVSWGLFRTKGPGTRRPVHSMADENGAESGEREVCARRPLAARTRNRPRTYSIGLRWPRYFLFNSRKNGLEVKFAAFSVRPSHLLCMKRLVVPDRKRKWEATLWPGQMSHAQLLQAKAVAKAAAASLPSRRRTSVPPLRQPALPRQTTRPGE